MSITNQVAETCVEAAIAPMIKRGTTIEIVRIEIASVIETKAIAVDAQDPGQEIGIGNEIVIEIDIVIAVENAIEAILESITDEAGTTMTAGGMIGATITTVIKWHATSVTERIRETENCNHSVSSRSRPMSRLRWRKSRR